MAGEKNLTDARPAGAYVGQSASDKLGFFGVTPVVQQVTAGAAAVTTGTTVTTLAVGVAEIYTALENLGLLAAS